MLKKQDNNITISRFAIVVIVAAVAFVVVVVFVVVVAFVVTIAST